MSSISTHRVLLADPPGVVGDATADRGSRQRREPDEEDRLLLRAATGDRSAFSDLLDRVGTWVTRAAAEVVRDPALAEEVGQEVLLEVWRTARRFDPCRGSARAWILTTTRRRAIDRVRSEQAARDRVDRIAVRDHQRSFDPVAEQVILHEEHTAVSAALAVLTDKQRCAIELAYYRGHTYREVAELLETPLGTVKTRIRDGLVRLRDALETPDPSGGAPPGARPGGGGAVDARSVDRPDPVGPTALGAGDAAVRVRG